MHVLGDLRRCVGDNRSKRRGKLYSKLNYKERIVRKISLENNKIYYFSLLFFSSHVTQVLSRSYTRDCDLFSPLYSVNGNRRNSISNRLWASSNESLRASSTFYSHHSKYGLVVSTHVPDGCVVRLHCRYVRLHCRSIPHPRG